MQLRKGINMVQLMIAILGGSAIWLVSRKEKWGRWGYILGLASQPFWLYSAYSNKQWGIFTLSIWYTYSWSQGIYNFWIRRDKKC